MLETYDGIVVGRREVGESGVFIDVLTDERGIIEACAHGAKKINSGILSSAAMFSYATFCFNKTKLRYTVNSAKPKYSFHALGSDITKLALASYFAQAVRFCTPEEQYRSDRQDSMVRFLAIALYETLGGHSPDTVKAVFELRFSAELGFQPNLVACDNCGQYDHAGGMYFLPDAAKLLCADCAGSAEGELLLPETLDAMRRAIYSPLDGCFKSSLSKEAERQFADICEGYFLGCAGRGFSALDYYKKMTIT